jgi:Calcineurin-like phosphoesterase
VVYLGDYVDRGEDSRGVVARLALKPLDGFESVHLMGNHEDFLLQFLEHPEVGPNWIYNGGDRTLASYGVPSPGPWAGTAAFDNAREALLAALPEAHLKFLRDLAASHVIGGYLFVHAGIRPGVALERQNPHDLMWIRREFLEHAGDFGKVVVHGHTPVKAIDSRPNRIGIDTGAAYGGPLSAVVLAGSERRFLQTGAW